MTSQVQIIVAVMAGILAGAIFLLAGRRLLAKAPAAEVQPEVEQPLAHQRPSISQDELSPEAKAFVAALQQRDEPKPTIDDPIWSVDIWDNRDHPGSGKSLPH